MKYMMHFDVNEAGEIVMALADESSLFFCSDPDLHDIDKAMFVQNLGALLAQTREGVAGCSYAHNREKQVETVTIHYNSGHKRDVNVSMDSYVAVIRDVCKHV